MAHFRNNLETTRPSISVNLTVTEKGRRPKRDRIADGRAVGGKMGLVIDDEEAEAAEKAAKKAAAAAAKV